MNLDAFALGYKAFPIKPPSTIVKGRALYPNFFGQLLKVEPATWLFVTVEEVEPTNNAAERAIRPAVLWPGVWTNSDSTSN